MLLFRAGYGGLQMVEDGVANLCLLTTSANLARVGGNWPALLAALMAESPHLRGRLQGAEERLDRPLSIAQIPYGSCIAPRPMHRATCSVSGTRWR